MNDFSMNLILWYEENKRDLPWRHTDDPYRIWVSEIMLQQTRVEAVKPYYAAFLQEFPTLASLAQADEDKLLKRWQGLGYYSRARNMKKAAEQCVEFHDGKLPKDYRKLQSLCGVGAYTAGAVASFAYGIPVLAIDTNVKRVVARYLAIDAPVGTPQADKPIREFLEKSIPHDRPGAFNQALIELGATLCGPDRSARCGGCPLMRTCRAFAENRTDTLPLRLPKAERRIERRTPLILAIADGRALQKRGDKGLLPGLWEVPALEGFVDEDGVRAYLEKRGCVPRSIKALPPVRHVFTHIVWEMNAYYVVLDAPGDFAFYSQKEREQLALPSAFKAYYPYFN